MKTKDVQKIRDETVQELSIKAQQLKEELARLSIEAMANHPKNTNAIGKKKKELAVILTIIREKRD